ncbi:MAG: hypothetical protein M1481_03615 [Candidatus Thermoplasmatota archaeon]|jgi:DNA-directed RNA polymerase subunit M/transcription elongation factor TFIIS|nr:hypothetical protein [Candidatus Thermoplasmatota archaeon]MCL5963714.1 hypothetical protein [Candidatus Thermoplasmatota archaeon]
MPTKKAPNKIIRGIVEEVVMEYGNIKSIFNLNNIVNKRLKRDGYKCSYSVLKREVFKIKNIETRVLYRKGKISNTDKVCPVCNHQMIEIKNKTLDKSDNIILFFRCQTCGFRKERWSTVPRIYLFKYKP